MYVLLGVETQLECSWQTQEREDDKTKDVQIYTLPNQKRVEDVYRIEEINGYGFYPPPDILSDQIHDDRGRRIKNVSGRIKKVVSPQQSLEGKLNFLYYDRSHFTNDVPEEQFIGLLIFAEEYLSSAPKDVPYLDLEIVRAMTEPSFIKKLTDKINETGGFDYAPEEVKMNFLGDFPFPQ